MKSGLHPRHGTMLTEWFPYPKSTNIHFLFFNLKQIKSKFLIFYVYIQNKEAKGKGILWNPFSVCPNGSRTNFSRIPLPPPPNPLWQFKKARFFCIDELYGWMVEKMKIFWKSDSMNLLCLEQEMGLADMKGSPRICFDRDSLVAMSKLAKWPWNIYHVIEQETGLVMLWMHSSTLSWTSVQALRRVAAAASRAGSFNAGSGNNGQPLKWYSFLHDSNSFVSTFHLLSVQLGTNIPCVTATLMPTSTGPVWPNPSDSSPMFLLWHRLLQRRNKDQSNLPLRHLPD